MIRLGSGDPEAARRPYTDHEAEIAADPELVTLFLSE
jgi:hypothetical protein